MSAAEQLLRLVHLIPLATRPEGLHLDEAAAMHGVTAEQIVADFRRLGDRAWYLPPGRTDDFQILLEGERIRVHAPPAFTRPPRLTPSEQMACAVALRCAGLGDAERAEVCREIEAALVGALGNDDADEGRGGSRKPGGAGVSDPPVEVVLQPAGADDLARTVSRGVMLRRRVRFGYVKAAADAPEVRRVEPWRVLHAEGESYLLGHDLDRGAPRLYRMDRILGVQLLDEGCSEPREPDVVDITDAGAVRLVVDADGEAGGSGPDGSDHDGHGGEEPRWARVRYSPRVARWVRERWEGDDAEDGSYLVRHRVFAEEWLVRHVLGHGTDAEVLEPLELRQQVVEAVREG
jgi:proteasome accessory factor C